MNESRSTTNPPVTYDNCAHVGGPFYHSTKSVLDVGTELVPGHESNFQQGRKSNHLYFTALVETATWGAELAAAVGGSGERGHIYVVETPGPVRGRPERDQQAVPGQPDAFLPDAPPAACRRRA